MSAMASQITGVLIVCSTVYSGADKRKHQSSASLAFARVSHWWPMDSPHKGPVTRKMFPFDDVILSLKGVLYHSLRKADFDTYEIGCALYTLAQMQSEFLQCWNMVSKFIYRFAILRVESWNVSVWAGEIWKYVDCAFDICGWLNLAK